MGGTTVDCTTFLAPAISDRAWLTAFSHDPAYSKSKDQTAKKAAVATCSKYNATAKFELYISETSKQPDAIRKNSQNRNLQLPG